MGNPVPSVTTKSRMSSGERRAQIVEAAVRLFAQSGFRGTTTRQLAAAVGVSEPVLYMHFQTKRDLYAAMIEHLAKGSQLSVGLDLQGIMQTRDDETFFLRLADEMLKWHIEDPARPRLLLYSALEGHDLSELFYQQQVVPFEQALGAYMAQRMDDGKFRRSDPLLAARAFCFMVAHYGLALTVFHHHDDEETRARTIAGIVEVFLNGIRNSEDQHK